MAINKRTAVHIANEIAMTRKQIENTDTQIEELQAQREAFALKLKAMESIVILEKAQVDFLPPSAAREQNPAELQLTPPAIGTHPAVGLRDGIRSILREANGHGMRGRDVTAALASRGIQISGKVDPATRVSGELYRLHKAGQVRKRANKYYALDNEAGG